jgi:hypothetical protein
MAERDDDVAALKFSRDFADVEFIDNTTVFVLLSVIKDKREKDEREGRGFEAPRSSEAFDRARDYAGRFGGALQGLQGRPVEEIDAVSSKLQALRVRLTEEEARLARIAARRARAGAGAGAAGGGGGGGGFGGGFDAFSGFGGSGMGADEDEDADEAGAEAEQTFELHSYEVVALTNLNPPNVAVAKSLVPSLERYRDDDLEEAVAILMRASAQSAKDAAAPAEGAVR